MSEKDLKRFKILTEVRDGKLKQSKAAKILGITPRQIRRLLCALRARGPKGSCLWSSGSLSSVYELHISRLPVPTTWLYPVGNKQLRYLTDLSALSANFLMGAL